MQKPRTALCAGQQVEARDEPWLVLSHEVFERTAVVTLRGVGHDNLGETQRLLTPFDRIVALTESTLARAATRASVLQAAAAAVAASPPWRESWTAATSHIELRAWQIEPALAAIRGEPRILLADEVGLGKTIQAGLIVSELMARALAERVLILTPASLRHQWAAELADKFAIGATIFDHSSLRLSSALVPPGANPWRTAPVIVSSIDLVKRPEVRSALEEVPFDLLVVDEAHHLTPGSDRAAVVSELAERTPWVVLATATPHSGDDSAYHFLCSLGAAGETRPPVIYQRRRSEVGPTLRRRVHLLSVAPTIDERHLLDATLTYARALWRAPSAGVHLVASVIARRAASSAVAARQTLARRLALLERGIDPIAQPSLPWDEGNFGDAVDDDVLGLPGLGTRDEELSCLRRLIDLAAAASIRSSKLDVIRRLLRRTAEPLIIFSEYRDVVVTVASAIADLASVVVIHGGLSGSCRRDLISTFISGHARVLVTTDAAGEGLNLQERCRMVVNLELPWNPVRLEQRVGRVDRLGQGRTVHALHLFHRDSFEDVVLATLERRRARAGVAASVLAHGDWSGPAEIERRLRAWSLQSRRSSRHVKTLYARPERRDHVGRGIVLLFGIDILDASGRLVQRELVAMRITFHSERLRTRHLTKGLITSLTTAPELRAAVDRELGARLSRVRADMSATATALDNRSRLILAELGRHDRAPLFQGSLFDRRSEQRSKTRAAAFVVQRERCHRRRATAQRLASLSVRAPRLIAAFPVR